MALPFESHDPWGHATLMNSGSLQLDDISGNRPYYNTSNKTDFKNYVLFNNISFNVRVDDAIIYSTNNQYYLVVKSSSDSNPDDLVLAIYDTTNGGRIHTYLPPSIYGPVPKTVDQTSMFIIMAGQGNLCLYTNTTNGSIVFASSGGANGVQPFTATLTDTGSLVIQDSTGTFVYSYPEPIPAPAPAPAPAPSPSTYPLIPFQPDGISNGYCRGTPINYPYIPRIGVLLDDGDPEGTDADLTNPIYVRWVQKAIGLEKKRMSDGGAPAKHVTVFGTATYISFSDGECSATNFIVDPGAGLTFEIPP
jgi:hypothetical protein